MPRLGRQDPGEPAGQRICCVIMELQLVEPLEVECHAAQFAVEADHAARSCGRPRTASPRTCPACRPSYLRRDAVNTAASSTLTGPVRGSRAVDPGREQCPADVVAVFQDGGDRLASQVLGEVDNVSAKVAERARASAVVLQSPGERERGISQPVLQVDRAGSLPRISPSRPSATSLRAMARAGTRR